ncbi:MAG: HNH endonuclease [Deltaproteobacteria bacterium]|nr:MAG: HNH endonuclease [Deltaproteobacteria bacterium]
MPRFVYTPEMLLFLQENYKKITDPLLAERFNQRFGLDKSPAAILSARKRYGFVGGGRMSKEGCQRRRMLTPEQHAWLAVEYIKSSVKECTRRLNEKFGLALSEQQVFAYLKRYKIRSGRTGHFTPGHKLGVGRPGKKNSGCFRKNSVPVNRRPLGAERITKGGYILIKIDEIDPHTGFRGHYVLKHRYIWEQVNGAVPAGKILRFKDGNPQNCTIENLILLDRAEHMELTRLNYDECPEDVQPTVVALAKLKVKTYQKKRKG